MKLSPTLLLFVLSASAFAGAYSDKVLSDSPFAYYRLDESSNTAATADQKGSNPGSYVNAPTSGVAGALFSDPGSTAFSFKKTSSQYVRLTTMGNFGSSQTSGYSVEYWLNTSDTATYQAVLGTINSSTNETFSVDLNYSGVAGRVRLYDRDPSGNRFESNFYTSTSGNVNVFDGAWHHIVHVYEPTAAAANRIRMYVDTVRQANDYMPTPTAPTNANYQFALTLGATNNRGTVQDFLNGSLDEIAFYKTVLPEATIAAHFAAAMPTPPTVTGPTLAELTDASVTLGGDVTDDGHAAVTARGVLVVKTSVDADPQLGHPDVTQLTAAGTTGAFTLPVIGLEEETSYSYRAYAINAAGTTYTAVAIFTTPRRIYLPAITGPTLANLTHSSATLGGDVTDDGRTAIIERGVLMARTSLEADPKLGGLNVAKVTATGTTGAFTVPVTGLDQETSYSYRAYATNAVGTTYTAAATFTTPTRIDFQGGNDVAFITGGVTRILPLANDVSPSGAPLRLVRVSNPAITIDDRSLIVPAGFTGTFTYLFTDGTSVGEASVTVSAGVAAANALSFSGLLREADGTIGASANLTFTRNGRVVSLRLRAGAATLRTYVILPAGALTVIRSTPLGTITLDRNADQTVSFKLVGSGGDLTGVLSAARASGAVARYHVALASVDATIPGGGYALVTVARNSMASLITLLPDGHPFTASTFLHDNGTLAFYSVVGSGVNPAAVVAGELTVADLSSTDLTGEVAWTKPPQRVFVRGLHLNGVDTLLTANGSLFRGEVPPSGAGTLALSGGDLAPAGVQAVTVTHGRPATPAGIVQSWRVIGNSMFTATLKVPGRPRPVAGTGVYLPKSHSAWGFFPGTDVGGRIELNVR